MPQTTPRGAAEAARPYFQRLIEDEELRNNIREAVSAARDAYSRMSNGHGPASALMDDKKVHKDLKVATESLREAADSLRNGKKAKRKRHPIRTLLLIGIVGGILALVVSEDLRKSVLDALFGAEEEFEYTSTTSAATDDVPA